MRRVFWVTLGATAGVLVVRRFTQVANRWTPNGVAERAGGLGERLAVFWSQVQQAAGEREEELREALGLDGRHDAVDARMVAPQSGQNGSPVAGALRDNR